MPEGFFSAGAISSSSKSIRIPECGACGLYKLCRSPKMEVAGKGREKILIIGEAPGKDEDDQNKPFVGKAGQVLQSALRDCGIDMFKDCWVTNSLICRPPKNATPTPKEIGYCRPNVLNTIRDLQPEKILLFGAVPVKSVIGHLWKESTGKMGRWIGWKIPSQQFNTWVCPNWHPSYVMRQDNTRNGPVVRKLWLDYMSRQLEGEGRPWKEVPDYTSMVERITDVKLAAKIIRKMIEKGGLVAFDYETTTLKPDGPHAEIYTCSICWEGKKTIAYPWQGEAIKATHELLRSKNVRKIASNLKFEERWTLKEFGHGVRKWDWDTMLAAHWIDNRPDITSIKFQSFVLLGAPDYDSHIKSYLEASTSNSKNRIKQIDLDQLLLYNGLDSLLEYKAAMVQQGKEDHRGRKLK